MEKDANSNNKDTIYVLWLSVVVSFIIGFVGILIATKSRSITVYIDATLSLLDMVVYYATIVVVRKLYCPPTKEFNFGFFKWEPMLLNFEAVSTVVICAVGVILAISTMLHPEHELYFNPNLALAYSTMQFILCCIITFALFCANKKNPNETLRENMLYWRNDTISPIILSFGFIVSILLRKYLPTTHIAHMVDPIMAFLVSLFFLKAPIESFYITVRDLVDKAATDEEIQHIINVLDKCFHKPSTNLVCDYKLKSRKDGRVLIVSILYRVNQGTTIDEIEVLNDKTKQALENEFKNISCQFYPTTKVLSESILMRGDLFEEISLLSDN